MEAFWDPTPRPAPRAWYLHEEEGGEPLPELHLCLTAQVPAGWGTDLDTVRAGPAEQVNPSLLPCPGSQGRHPDLDSEGTQSRGARYLPPLGLGPTLTTAVSRVSPSRVSP